MNSLVSGVNNVTVDFSGRWSDPNIVWVSHRAYGSRDRLAREMFGDVDCPFTGRRVGVSVFKTPKLESPISSANLSPLGSCREENQRVSWALTSPTTRASLPGRIGISEGI